MRVPSDVNKHLLGQGMLAAATAAWRLAAAAQSAADDSGTAPQALGAFACAASGALARALRTAAAAAAGEDPPALAIERPAMGPLLSSVGEASPNLPDGGGAAANPPAGPRGTHAADPPAAPAWVPDADAPQTHLSAAGEVRACTSSACVLVRGVDGSRSAGGNACGIAGEEGCRAALPSPDPSCVVDACGSGAVEMLQRAAQLLQAAGSARAGALPKSQTDYQAGAGAAMRQAT